MDNGDRQGGSFSDQEINEAKDREIRDLTDKAKAEAVINHPAELNLKETEAKPTYSKMVHVVIDADSLIYRACHAGEKEHREAAIPRDHPLFKEMPIASMEDMQRSILHSMIGGIIWKMREDLNLEGVDISAYSLVFTPKKHTCDKMGLKVNFRYEIIDEYNDAQENLDTAHPQYKASRKGMQLPEGIPEMFTYVEELNEALFSNHSEADDWVYRMKMMNPEGIVIACLDKDIYEGTPAGSVGHYNYNRNEWIYTTEEEAKLFFYRQCMTGDSSDGIKGIHRYGPKTAEKDFPVWTDEADMWNRVLQKFEEKGYAEDYAILMMRLVNLSQLTPNFKLRLWEPPILSEIVDGPGVQGTYENS